jgi:hypothetical protein
MAKLAKKHTVVLVLDEDDYRDFLKELSFRGRRDLPEGESNFDGAHVGEMIRDLWEYRDLYESDPGKLREPASTPDRLALGRDEPTEFDRMADEYRKRVNEEIDRFEASLRQRFREDG